MSFLSPIVAAERAGRAYYNEIDPFAAAWLRNLVSAGAIAPGEVDERDIRDVEPFELLGFTQCHFFAGIGVWSHALRGAGWGDDRSVWTGSCPCQPFSAAGRGGGISDERHLWPHLFHLLEVCRPAVWLGEQVASKDGLAWLDLVSADLEGTGYAVGALDLCAAGVGAPHIRQRLYIGAVRDDDRGSAHDMVDGLGSGLEGQRGHGRDGDQPGRLHADAPRSTSKAGAAGRVGNARVAPGGRDAGNLHGSAGTAGRGGRADGGFDHGAFDPGAAGGVGYAYGGLVGEGGSLQRDVLDGQFASDGGVVREACGGLEAVASGVSAHAGPTNGFWGSADWIGCRDGRFRAVEPGTFPLVDGTPARVGRVRGYGNAIVGPLAQAFIEAFDATLADLTPDLDLAAAAVLDVEGVAR